MRNFYTHSLLYSNVGCVSRKMLSLCWHPSLKIMHFANNSVYLSNLNNFHQQLGFLSEMIFMNISVICNTTVYTIACIPRVLHCKLNPRKFLGTCIAYSWNLPGKDHRVKFQVKLPGHGLRGAKLKEGVPNTHALTFLRANNLNKLVAGDEHFVWCSREVPNV